MFCINKGAGKYTSINYNNAKVVMEYLFPLPTPYEIIDFSFVNISFNLSYSLNLELFKSETIRTHMIMKSESFHLLLSLLIHGKRYLYLCITFLILGTPPKVNLTIY